MEIGDIDLYAHCKKAKLNLIEKSNICKNVKIITIPRLQNQYGYYIHLDIFIEISKQKISLELEKSSNCVILA
jgi:hypothetical protein